MSARFHFFLILMLLLQPLNGLLLASPLPHHHILVGGITPEQLRAHEEAERQSLQAQIAVQEKLREAPALENGGMILSVPFRGEIFSVPFQMEAAFFVFCLTFVPAYCFSLAVTRLSSRPHARFVFELPPRLLSLAR